MKLTAADKYIASLYEAFVDKGLHLEQIRVELGHKGIKRNLYQIEYDLTTRYEFHGYAASHPAPAKVALTEVDREIELMPKSLLNRATSRVAMPCYRLSGQDACAGSIPR